MHLINKSINIIIYFVFSNCVRYGAYSAYEIYTTEEVRELIYYARVRGIRVVIEIDSPAHAGNGWQWGKVTTLFDYSFIFILQEQNIQNKTERCRLNARQEAIVLSY